MAEQKIILTWTPDASIPKSVTVGQVTIKCVLVSSKSSLEGVGKTWVLDFSRESDGARKVEKGNGIKDIWGETLGVEWKVVGCDGKKTVTLEYRS